MYKLYSNVFIMIKLILSHVFVPSLFSFFHLDCRIICEYSNIIRILEQNWKIIPILEQNWKIIRILEQNWKIIRILEYYSNNTRILDIIFSRKVFELIL